MEKQNKNTIVSRRTFLKSSIASVGAAAFYSLGNSCQPEKKKPNVIFVFADQWRAQDYEIAKNKLLYAFLRKPVETANTLLAIHKYSMLKLNHNDLKVIKDNLQYTSSWKFGLVRAPFGEDTRTFTPNAMTRSIEGAFPP